MPYIVNGQIVTEDKIRTEEARIRNDPQWRGISDEVARSKRIRESAEFSAIDVVLTEQYAASDPRPIDPVLLERELQGQKATGNCRSAYNGRQLWLWIEWHLRLVRTTKEMTAGASIQIIRARCPRRRLHRRRPVYSLSGLAPGRV